MASRTATADATEALVHMWRTAAHAVATDPVAPRRAAYEGVIALVCAQLAPYRSLHDLADQMWNIKLWALATTSGMTVHGRVLNYQVVAAAACWRRLCQVLAEADLGDSDEV